MSPGRGGPRAGGQAQGGSGAVIGFRVIRYSGVQGVALVTSNLLQLATIGVIAGFLGASDLGRYSLLLFLGALVSMVFGLLSKPGTIRRTFGGGDDEDDDEDDGEEVISASPKHSLGAGLMWSILLGIAATALVVALRQPIADLLLGGEADATLVFWAGIIGGAGVLFRVGSISLWFERRPTAFLVAEVSRPLLMLVLMTALLASGGGLTDAVAGVAIGTAVAALLTVALLRGSFEPNLQPSEVVAITKAAGRRVPIVSSLWTIQNADVFLLSRVVDHVDLGVYTLAAKLGLLASFLPQAFRVAMRPLRKSAVFRAMRSQYGRSTSSGQLLGYFVLTCISSILVMVLAGEWLIDLAPSEFAAASALIPLTAAALVMPALWRTLNGQTAWPGKARIHFVVGTVGAALVFIGLCLALAPVIGIYAPPVAMLAGFVAPMSYFFVRCQRGPNRIDFPYSEIARALAIAGVIGGGFHLLPNLGPVAEAVVIVALVALYGALLFVFRVIPESHWPALGQIGASVISGRGDRVNPRRGLRSIDAEDRAELRLAVTERLGPAALVAPAARPDPPPGSDSSEAERTEGARLVRVLRLAGREGGAPVRRRTRWDGAAAEFLFADEPVAVRNASMRALLDQGADAQDLRALEDLVEHLARIPPDAWEGAPAAESPTGRRRRAAGRRSREAMARAAKAIGRRI
jgi:O-antigen/teichoic acid export membrane protein